MDSRTDTSPDASGDSHEEAALEPDLPIIDAHHHLWDAPAFQGSHPAVAGISAAGRYLFDELKRDAGSGHNVVATVFVECRSFWRQHAAADAPLGEIEFANGVAAMFASGQYGPLRACAAIIGFADLTRPDGLDEYLDRAIAAGNGRLRGIRQSGPHDPDPDVLGPLARHGPHYLAREEVRRGVRTLHARGLVFDTFVLEPQLAELPDLARNVDGATIVLNHVGMPLGIGSYRGTRAERFGLWRGNMALLAQCPNVHVKLGGLGQPFPGFEPASAAPSSEELALLWRPYIETCIELFGVRRCLFESNFPVDRWTCGYTVLWNAFKRIVAGASVSEKEWLFAKTAAAVYRLDHNKT